MRTAIIGGGAAGFFLAINLKEMQPTMQVDIFERSQHVLAKVEVSGGGRCNCTNTFEGISNLSAVYPRGHRLLKRLFNVFNHNDAFCWFESHGVPLTIQEDHCVFPAAQDSHAIIGCFLSEAHRHGITIHTRHPIRQIEELNDYDFVVVTTGGSPKSQGFDWLRHIGHEIIDPVPSLFSMSVDDPQLKALMGTVSEQATVALAGTKIKTDGPLLITHWGLSGPAILRLSSHAARILHENNYHAHLSINWTGMPEAVVRELITEIVISHPKQQITTHTLPGLTQRLWNYIVGKGIGDKGNCRWSDIGKKDLNRLINTLTADDITITGRAPFRDEFVTCGGVALSGINPTTMESRHRKNLYFAGEVLDIDGVTGGFNFQAAWTTAYVAAQGITAK